MGSYIDRPWYVRYVLWLKSVLSGDFGYSEQIFHVPGIGELLVRSIGQGDTPS